MRSLEAWMRSHPRTILYLLAVSTANFLLNVADVMQ